MKWSTAKPRKIISEENGAEISFNTTLDGSDGSPSRSDRFIPGERGLPTCSIGRWSGPRSSLDVVAEEKLSGPTENRSQSSSPGPVASVIQLSRITHKTKLFLMSREEKRVLYFISYKTRSSFHKRNLLHIWYIIKRVLNFIQKGKSSGYIRKKQILTLSRQDTLGISYAAKCVLKFAWKNTNYNFI
jgi:hypothetical protein